MSEEIEKVKVIDKEYVVDEISSTEREKMLQKTAKYLPDNPADSGMRASTIKPKFYGFATDLENSLLAAHNKAIRRINEYFANLIEDMNTIYALALEESKTYTYRKVNQEVLDRNEAIKAELEKLIGNAPEALDTLSELSKALGEDPNFATTITNLISGKLSINQGEDNKLKILKIDSNGNVVPIKMLSDYNMPSEVMEVVNKAITFAKQELTEDQKAQVRSNIGAGDSSFSGNYSDLKNKPTIPSAGNGLDSNFNVKYGTSANTACQGNDSRLSNSRPANGGNSDTSNAVKDAKNGNIITFAYSEDGMNVNVAEWLAVWEGYKLKAISKSSLLDYKLLKNKPNIPFYYTCVCYLQSNEDQAEIVVEIITDDDSIESCDNLKELFDYMSNGRLYPAIGYDNHGVMIMGIKPNTMNNMVTAITFDGSVMYYASNFNIKAIELYEV